MAENGYTLIQLKMEELLIHELQYENIPIEWNFVEIINLVRWLCTRYLEQDQAEVENWLVQMGFLTSEECDLFFENKWTMFEMLQTTERVVETVVVKVKNQPHSFLHQQIEKIATQLDRIFSSSFCALPQQFNALPPVDVNPQDQWTEDQRHEVQSQLEEARDAFEKSRKVKFSLELTKNHAQDLQNELNSVIGRITAFNTMYKERCSRWIEQPESNDIGIGEIAVKLDPILQRLVKFTDTIQQIRTKQDHFYTIIQPNVKERTKEMVELERQVEIMLKLVKNVRDAHQRMSESQNYRRNYLSDLNTD